MTALFVYAAGGFGREVGWLAESAGTDAGFEFLGFLDDTPELAGTACNGYPVLAPEVAASTHPGAGVVIAVGDPAARRALTRKVVQWGFHEVSLIHTSVQHSRWVEIGAGTVICAGSILTTNIRLGRGVQINLACTIGHDAVLEDFVTLAPGVHVSGRVRIEEGAYVGTGANIINGTPEHPLVIGKGSVVGAGACVVRDVEPGTTVIGVPARPVQR